MFKKILLAMILVLLMSACKLPNKISRGEYRTSDFELQCLYGHYYMIRIVGDMSLMAPVFNEITHLPEACDERL